ncbi:TPA: TIGR02594 family protein, partial [Escherichia coli]
VGIRSTRFESAKSYLDWGEKLDTPAYGCIVVFTRVGGGHVGFVVGRRANGDLLVLGGNQGDAVNIRAFPTSRVSGYRWPADEPRNTALLPVGDAATSTNEA